MRNNESNKYSARTDNSADASRIISIIVSRLRQIVLFSVIGGVCVFLVCVLLVHPKYTSYIELYTSAPSTGSEDVRSETETSAVSGKMAASYESLLRTDEAFERLRSVTGTDYRNDELRRCTDIVVDGKSGIIRIYATTEDPYLSAGLCDGYAVAASELIRDVLKGSYVKVLGSAVPNGVPSSPPVSGVTFASFIGFFILFTAAFIIYDMFFQGR